MATKKQQAKQLTNAKEIRVFAQDLYEYIWSKNNFSKRGAAEKFAKRYQSRHGKQHQEIKSHFSENIGKAVRASQMFLREYLREFFEFASPKTFKSEVKLIWWHWIENRNNIFVKTIDTLCVLAEAVLFCDLHKDRRMDMDEAAEIFVELFEEYLSTHFFKSGGWKQLEDLSLEWYGTFSSYLNYLGEDGLYKNFDAYLDVYGFLIVEYLLKNHVMFPVSLKVLEDSKVIIDDKEVRMVVYVRPGEECNQKPCSAELISDPDLISSFLSKQKPLRSKGEIRVKDASWYESDYGLSCMNLDEICSSDDEDHSNPMSKARISAVVESLRGMITKDSFASGKNKATQMEIVSFTKFPLRLRGESTLDTTESENAVHETISHNENCDAESKTISHDTSSPSETCEAKPNPKKYILKADSFEDFLPKCLDRYLGEFSDVCEDGVKNKFYFISEERARTVKDLRTEKYYKSLQDLYKENSFESFKNLFDHFSGDAFRLSKNIKSDSAGNESVANTASATQVHELQVIVGEETFKPAFSVQQDVKHSKPELIKIESTKAFESLPCGIPLSCKSAATYQRVYSCYFVSKKSKVKRKPYTCKPTLVDHDERNSEENPSQTDV